MQTLVYQRYIDDDRLLTAYAVRPYGLSYGLTDYFVLFRSSEPGQSSACPEISVLGVTASQVPTFLPTCSSYVPTNDQDQTKDAETKKKIRPLCKEPKHQTPFI
eukprot:1196174-Prorocentrum_minimum.AAC.13